MNTREQALAAADELSQYQTIALDFEDNDVPRASPDYKILGLSLAGDPGRAWYIPVNHKPPRQNTLFAPDYSQLTWEQAAEVFRFVWTDRKYVCHHIKNEIQVLYRMGEKTGYAGATANGCGAAFDTYIVQKLMDSELPKYGLKPLTRMFLGRDPLDYKQVCAKGETLERIPLERVLAYAGPDATNCLGLAWHLWPKLNADNQIARDARNLLNKLEMPISELVARMELVGMQLNQDRLREIYKITSKEVDDAVHNMTAILQELCPDFEAQFGEFRPTARESVRSALYEVLQIDVPRGVELKGDLDQKVVLALRRANLNNDRAVRFMDLYIQWSGSHKIRSTYTINLIELSSNGLLNPSLDSVGTKQSRFTSRSPNGQTWPRRKDKYGIRECFLPPSPYEVWVCADEVSMEMCGTAALSKCPVLSGILTGRTTLLDIESLGNVRISDTQAFIKTRTEKLITDNGMDPDKAAALARRIDTHTYAAADSFAVLYDKVTPQQRDSAKTINFSIIYGTTEYGLADSLQCSKEEASKRLLKYKYQTFPGVGAYIDANNEEIFRNGYVKTDMGRYRWVPKKYLSLPKEKWGAVFRWATNMKVQGSMAELIKLAMLVLDKMIREEQLEAALDFQVHDELIVASMSHCARRVGELMSEALTYDFYGVPIAPDGFQVKGTLAK